MTRECSTGPRTISIDHADQAALWRSICRQLKGREAVCCESFIGDGVGPPGVGLQEQIPNHHKLRG